MAADSQMGSKKLWLGGIPFIALLALFSTYFVYNLRYQPSRVRSSIVLYNSQKNEESKLQQIEYTKVGYLQNGYEQGTMDARCVSWLCSYNLDIGIMRGEIVRPSKRLKINAHRLSKDEKIYYNSGYIKGYKQVCSKYRDDCDDRIRQMISDYSVYYNAPLYDANNDHHLMLAREVKAKIENAQAYYSIDGGDYIVIDTDKMVGNNKLPVRENLITRNEVSADKRYILLEVLASNGTMSYLVFEIDTNVLHKVNIDPFEYSAVRMSWTSDNRLLIQKFGDTPSGRGIVAKFISTTNQKPWEVEQLTAETSEGGKTL